MRTHFQAYADLQSKIRIGTYDRTTKELVEARVGAELAPAPADVKDPDYIPMMGIRNETRRQLEILRLQSISCNLTSDWPMLITAHIKAKSKINLSPAENNFIVNVPDSETDKVAPALPVYPGAYMLINNNIDVPCGLAQGTRCRVVGWPHFPPHTEFQDGFYHGARVRLPVRRNSFGSFERADPDYIYVELMSHPLRFKPLGQPKHLPCNVVALPMCYKEMRVQLRNLLLNPRKSVKLKTLQLPLRPANALTTYGVQGCEFSRAIIVETNAMCFYTQISRGTQGLQSIVISKALPKNFKPSANLQVISEIERLRECHEATLQKFKQDQEENQQPNDTYDDQQKESSDDDTQYEVFSVPGISSL